jgi:hypothetical protein
MAGQSNVSNWPVETIPDIDNLYYRIHKMWIVGSEITPGVFRNIGRGMSADWDKYSTPEQSRQRAKMPNDNAVVELNVGDVRHIPDQNVEHTPSKKNRSHTDVTGEKDEEVRIKFRRICSWAITL